MMGEGLRQRRRSLRKCGDERGQLSVVVFCLDLPIAMVVPKHLKLSVGMLSATVAKVSRLLGRSLCLPTGGQGKPFANNGCDCFGCDCA